ncbi:hypothetical protein TD95_003822, partial [Thielaviopsis punctulata]
RRYNGSFRRHGKAIEPPSSSAAADSSKPPEDVPATDSSESPVSEILSSASSSSSAPPPPNLFTTASASPSPSSADLIPLSTPPFSSSSSSASSSTAPSPPPYRPPHPFDSFTAATRLHQGGYTLAQSVLLMKSIRGHLTSRLAAARAQLVSKSDVENEIYLFRAACSELGNEIKNTRRVADEEMRSQRTQLQHELDILSQSISQEIAGMNDAVKGMIGDRSMMRREEHKARESAIQQLNYKISIMLTSDAKADIETIRWILIRRAVLGILFMAVISISLMRYTSLVRKQRQKDAADEKKRREKQRALDAAAQTVSNQVHGHVPASSF